MTFDNAIRTLAILATGYGIAVTLWIVRHDTQANQHRAQAEQQRHEEAMTALKELIRRTGSPPRAIRFHPGDRFSIINPRIPADGPIPADGEKLNERAPPPKRP